MDWEIMLFSFGIDFLITVSGYLLVPTIIALFRRKYKEKTILIISIVNCAVVWTIFQIIEIELNGEPSIGSPVFLWGGLGYLILRKCCLKKEAKKYVPICQEETPDNINLSDLSGWQCSCGRRNADYVSTCYCGKSKRDLQKNLEEETSAPAASDSEPNQIRFCRKCGNKLLTDAAFCTKCGTKVLKE